MTNLLKQIKRDLKASAGFNHLSKLSIFMFNRGFHALLFYRISNYFSKLGFSFFSKILTRFIQIIYSIDIDFSCSIEGGVTIVHGTGIVIGSGVKIQSGVVLFHQVTLGRRTFGYPIPNNDGFPEVKKNVILSAGCVLIGPIIIGENSIIGANVVLSQNIDAHMAVKIPSNFYSIITRIK